METNQLYEQIANTLNSLAAKLNTFDDEQINQIPGQGGWSAGQLAEHLLKSYPVDGLIEPVRSCDRDPNEKVQMLQDTFLNFDIKMNSPEFILPGTGPYNRTDLLSSLEEAKTKILELIASHDLSKICTDFVVPELGEMSRSEWIHLLLFHTQRHLKQLEAISAGLTVKA